MDPLKEMSGAPRAASSATSEPSQLERLYDIHAEQLKNVPTLSPATFMSLFMPQAEPDPRQGQLDALGALANEVVVETPYSRGFTVQLPTVLLAPWSAATLKRAEAAVVAPQESKRQLAQALVAAYSQVTAAAKEGSSAELVDRILAFDKAWWEFCDLLKTESAPLPATPEAIAERLRQLLAQTDITKRG